jgi:hypothetical protein
MRLNLANVLELVVPAAAGMALARFQHHQNGGRPYSAFSYLELVAAFLGGISLVMGLLLWVEASRPNAHRVWGIGRWTWSLSATSIVLPVVWKAVTDSSITYLRQHIMITLADLESSSLQLVVWSMNLFPGFLISFLVTAWIAGWRRDPAPDYREWTGLAFAGLLVIHHAALQLLMILQ